MVVAAKLKKFLDDHKTSYHVLRHHERFTSPEIAQALHVPGKELAKVVMIKADGRLVMAVLPANYQVDLGKFGKACKAKKAELASEADFGKTFPDCELGAMPPFGNLYGVDVFVDESLAEDESIVFEAGNHHEAIKLRYADFAELVKPRVGAFAAG